MKTKRSIKVMAGAMGLTMAVASAPSHALLGGNLLGDTTNTVDGTLGNVTGILGGGGGGLLGGLDLGGLSPLDVLGGGDILGGVPLIGGDGDLLGGLGDGLLDGLLGGLLGGGGGNALALLPGSLANVGGSGGQLSGILDEVSGRPLGGIGLPGIPDPGTVAGQVSGLFGAATEIVAAGPTGALASVTQLLDQTPVRTCEASGAQVDLTQGAMFTQHNVLAVFGGDELWSYYVDANGVPCLADITRSGGNGDNIGIDVEAQHIVNQGEFDGQHYVFMVNPGPGVNQNGLGLQTVLDSVGSAPADALLGGNSTISVFRVNQNGTSLTDVADIGSPNGRSVAVDVENNRIYTVGAGSQLELFGTSVPIVPERIRGFDFNPNNGQLTAIPGSLRDTADTAGDPGDINVSPDGDFLSVSQRKTTFALIAGPEEDRIEVYPVDVNTGVPQEVQVNIPAPPENDDLGNSPFGAFFFTDNFQGQQSGLRYYTTYGFGGLVPNEGQVAAYNVNDDGSLDGIGGENGTGIVRTRGSDNCWMVMSNPTAADPSVRYLYTSAATDSAVLQHPVDRATGEIIDDEAFEAGRSEVRSSRPENAELFQATAFGLDIAITDGGPNENQQQYVYVNNIPLIVPAGPTDAVEPGLSNIEAFKVLPNGSLQQMPDARINGETSRHQGLVAY